MRKALFGVVLVAASFGGGAVVNGPGLRWVRTMVMNRLGLQSSEKGHDTLADGSIPPLAIEPTEVDPGQDAAASSKPADTGVSTATPTTTANADTKPSTAPEPPPLALDPGPISPPPTDPSVSPTSSKPEPTAAPVSVSATPSGTGDWAEIRRGLKEAGVSRFTMDGEPGGRVRFACVIPVAGRRAVGQHFEAEGDDETQAARAVLKRIALWRATDAETETP